MSEIQLTPETISAYKALITSPKDNGFEFTSITEYFEKSETVTAKHILAESYVNHINKPLPKVVLYIIMNEIYGQCIGRDENKIMGYYLKPKSK